MIKELMEKLRYMRSIVGPKYTLHFKTARLGFVSYKKNLVHEIVIVSSVQFNSFIDFE